MLQISTLVSAMSFGMTHVWNKLVAWDRQRLLKKVRGQTKSEVTSLKIVVPPKRGKIRIKKKRSINGKSETTDIGTP